MEKPARRLSPVRVEGDSMSPTLRAGSLIAVSPLRGEPTRGSIVVVRRPDGSEHLKRVVALPGDRFVVQGKEIELESDDFAVTGDNAAASTDSRHYGPVRRGNIVAVARFCYWPPRAWGSLAR